MYGEPFTSTGSINTLTHLVFYTFEVTTQALISVVMQVPNWDISLANEGLAQIYAIEQVIPSLFSLFLSVSSLVISPLSHYLFDCIDFASGSL